ncbi:MAG: armadillo/beta-catenin-like repeat-containing protein [Planctomycetaceae bacterium]|jgi:hypothetical protein|nr:armadillo/beta-catenin-like repeat-containing protein [Planctomycetaceae bacterium]
MNPDLCESTGITNDLINELYQEGSVNVLVPLLESDDIRILRAAIWIVSELGQKSKSLQPYLFKLLKNNDLYIRYYALDTIQSCALYNDNQIQSELIELLHDPSNVIRNKVRSILSLYNDDYSTRLK